MSLGTLSADVVSLICEELESDAFSYFLRDEEALEDRQGLLSLGLAARAFMHPAMNSLWKTLRDVVPLLSVLPETRLVEEQKMLVGPLAPASLDRLRYYTSRVLYFDQFGIRHEPNIHPSVYPRLGQLQPLFPSLKKFSAGHSLSSSAALPLFLSPTISRAALPIHHHGDDSDGPDFGPFLSLLAWKSPAVRFLTLNADSSLYTGIGQSLKCFSHLRTLRVNCRSYDLEFGSTIASMEMLTDLELTLPFGVSLRYNGVTDGFPSLQTLDIASSFVEAHRLLDMISSPTLRTLSIIWNRELESESGPDLHDHGPLATSHVARFTSLRILSVMDKQAIQSHLQRQTMDVSDLWAVLKPLLRVHWMRSLTYYLPLPLTDERTEELAIAWPEMEHLSFKARSFESYDRPCIDSLVHFARHTRRLRRLEFPVCTQGPFSSVLPPPTLYMHPLQSLICQLEQEMDDPFAVAVRLHQIFPGLKSVYGGEGWDTVQSMLETFHFLRKQHHSPEFKEIMDSS